MSKPKNEYLSYIEETPKHYKELNKAAVTGVRKSVSKSKKKGLSITYKEGDKIIKEYPNGKKVEIGNLENRDIQVEVGTTQALS